MTKKEIKALANNDLIVAYILARDIAMTFENSRECRKRENELLNELFVRGLISEKNKHDLHL